MRLNLALKLNKLLILSCLLTPLLVQAQNWKALEWRKKKSKNEITVYTAKVKDSPHIAVKTEMQLKTSLSNLVALVMDADKSTEWVDKCYSSTLHKKLSDTEYYQYFISKPPWPLRKRDFLLHVNISQDKNLTVSIHAKAKNNIYPKQKKIIRIEKTESLWEFIPLDKGKVKIINYAHVEPKVKVPKWITRKAIIDTPYKTLRNMREILKSQKKQATFTFIKEKYESQ